MIGGFTALSTKGVSSLISLELYRIFTFPVTYLLTFVLLLTAVLQVKYLNKALARFSSTVRFPSQSNYPPRIGPLYHSFHSIFIPRGFTPHRVAVISVPVFFATLTIKRFIKTPLIVSK